MLPLMPDEILFWGHLVGKPNQYFHCLLRNLGSMKNILTASPIREAYLFLSFLSFLSFSVYLIDRSEESNSWEDQNLKDEREERRGEDEGEEDEGKE